MKHGIEDLRRADAFETPTALSKNFVVGSMSFDFHCTITIKTTPAYNLNLRDTIGRLLKIIITSIRFFHINSR